MGRVLSAGVGEEDCVGWNGAHMQVFIRLVRAWCSQLH
jgi:hypothetical protein